MLINFEAEYKGPNKKKKYFGAPNIFHKFFHIKNPVILCTPYLAQYVVYSTIVVIKKHWNNKKYINSMKLEMK